MRASWQAPRRRPGAKPPPRACAIRAIRARMAARAPSALPAHTKMCQDQNPAAAAPRVSHVYEMLTFSDQQRRDVVV